MKSGLMLGLVMLWFPYAAFIPQQPGNPDGQPYLGEAGSVYDSAANSPKTVGVVTYDPKAPMPAPPANPQITPTP